MLLSPELRKVFKSQPVVIKAIEKDQLTFAEVNEIFIEVTSAQTEQGKATRTS